MRSISLILIAVTCTVMLAGCQNIEKENQIFSRYYMTELKTSTSADVLPMIAQDRELTSQSESVIVAWDQKKNHDRIWFNMVAFDEDELTAVRKYAFNTNETPQGIYDLFPTQNIRFDASMVLSEDVLGEPYNTEDARRIAFIEALDDNFDSDIAAVRQDSETLEAGYMLIKQVLNTILHKLDNSPALAQRLSDPAGMEFDHMNFDEGKVRMTTEGDIMKFKVKIGSYVKDFEEHPDVKSM
ncbi:hypothetical protein STSP2_00498 [Anaerohalosphaera lusitana]|uniref:Lipoprotein n=1 Tax=Anaerohalosphaera lusitana TaxID=1936003 RepID=A0A1U9NI03_9BACT|nr:hypothetical protein [Anaerohalosphaera lusitana]AQT67354.1 hypothetical protein STSP2_00498 [Anaerohalosphaera lusitana]